MKNDNAIWKASRCSCGTIIGMVYGMQMKIEAEDYTDRICIYAVRAPVEFVCGSCGKTTEWLGESEEEGEKDDNEDNDG